MRNALLGVSWLVGSIGVVSGLRGQSLPDPGDFTSVLHAVVAGERVDYGRLARDRLALREFLATIGRVGTRSLDAADRDSRMAFWINAYHACLLDLVARNYPIDRGNSRTGRRQVDPHWPANSVQQIDAAFTRRTCHVALADRSLDEIVHQILRPMGDPRVHCALSCAALGCPALASVAYSPAQLDEQLEAAVRRFLDDPRHLAMPSGEPRLVRVHSLFRSYAADFGGEAGVRRFLAGYVARDLAARILDPDTRLEYVEPDWTLNDLEAKTEGEKADSSRLDPRPGRGPY